MSMRRNQKLLTVMRRKSAEHSNYFWQHSSWRPVKRSNSASPTTPTRRRPTVCGACRWTTVKSTSVADQQINFNNGAQSQLVVTDIATAARHIRQNASLFLGMVRRNFRRLSRKDFLLIQQKLYSSSSRVLYTSLVATPGEGH
jgi:hypothetical protein